MTSRHMMMCSSRITWKDDRMGLQSSTADRRQGEHAGTVPHRHPHGPCWSLPHLDMDISSSQGHCEVFQSCEIPVDRAKVKQELNQHRSGPGFKSHKKLQAEHCTTHRSSLRRLPATPAKGSRICWVGSPRCLQLYMPEWDRAQAMGSSGSPCRPA